MASSVKKKNTRSCSVEFSAEESSTSSDIFLGKSGGRIPSDERPLTGVPGDKQNTVLPDYTKFSEDEASRTNKPTNKPPNYDSTLSTSQPRLTTTVTSVIDQHNLSKYKNDAELATSEKSFADCSTNHNSHDTDGGWAWMVLVAGFLQFVVSSGIYYSWGVFFVPLLDEFGRSRAETAWVFSTNAAVHQLAGPLGGLLIPRLGTRLTVMLGGLLAAAGCIMSACAESLEFMFFSHGVVNAIGTSLNFCGWIVGISHFFVKKRGLALGFAMSGSGWGVLALGPLLAKFVQAMGWRNAMFMCAGLSLNFIVFGAFIYNNNIAKNESLRHEKYMSANSGSGKGNMTSNNKSECEGNDVDLDFDNCKYQQKAMRNEVEPVAHPGNKTVQDKKKKIEWIGVQISCVLSIMATSSVYTLLKDWITWIGLSEIISYSLMAAGVGDIVGRISAGILSWVIAKYNVSVLVLFGGTHVVLAVSLAVASLGATPATVLCSVVGIGFAGGLQSVFAAFAPMGNNSANDLGTLLLVGGVGALVGPPFAAFLVDYSDSYSVALMSCAVAPALGAVTCVVCYILSVLR